MSGDRSERPGEGEERFRRPDWAGPGPEEVPEGAGGSSVPAPLPAEELGRALLPLKDLAEAFRQNSETLRVVAEGQSRLARRIERSDRSEAVIQSTQALNDTFRGVRKTQEGLLRRLDEAKRRPLLLVLSVVLVLLVFVGGVTWLFLGWLDRNAAADREQEGRSVREIVADSSDRIEDLKDELARGEVRLTELQGAVAERDRRVTELTKELGEKTTEIAGLRESQGALTRTLRENASLSTQVAGLTNELAIARREAGEAEARVRELERKIEELEGKLSLLARRAAAPAPAPSPASPEAASAGAAAPAPEVDRKPAIPPGAVTNPAQLERIRDVLNRLLLGGGSTEGYRIVSIGGAWGTVLYRVVAANVDASGREVKRIEAAECRIHLDDARRRAEFRFRNGYLFYYGVRAPMWGEGGGSYTVPVANIDPAEWRKSGLTIFQNAR